METPFFECEGLILDRKKVYAIKYQDRKIDEKKLIDWFVMGDSPLIDREWSEYFRALNLLGIKYTVEEATPKSEP